MKLSQNLYHIIPMLYLGDTHFVSTTSPYYSLLKLSHNHKNKMLFCPTQFFYVDQNHFWGLPYHSMNFAIALFEGVLILYPQHLLNTYLRFIETFSQSSPCIVHLLIWILVHIICVVPFSKACAHYLTLPVSHLHTHICAHL